MRFFKQSSQNDRYLTVVEELEQVASRYEGPAIGYAVATIMERNADLSFDRITALFRERWRNILPSERGQLNEVLMYLESFSR